MWDTGRHDQRARCTWRVNYPDRASLTFCSLSSTVSSVAAKDACAERVVCFAGDGDFQTNCQELGTAMQPGARRDRTLTPRQRLSQMRAAALAATETA